MNSLPGVLVAVSLGRFRILLAQLIPSEFSRISP